MLRLYLYARVRLLLFFCTRDRGCSKHPAFPAPSSPWAKRICKARANAPRECGGVFCGHCERRRTPPPFEASAALRHLRVTATRERHACATALPLSLEVRASSASLEGRRGQLAQVDRQRLRRTMDCFASLAMTAPGHSGAMRKHRTRNLAPHLEIPG